MNFAFSAEQDELRRSVRKYLEEKSPEAEVRRLMESDSGYDPAVWSQMAGELGLQGLAVPEDFGGSGAGWVELVIVFEEMGRALLCAPYLSTVGLALSLLEAAGDTTAQKDYLPGIANGDTIATVAIAERDGGWEPLESSVIASATGGGWTLTGEKHFVTDGHIADLILVSARLPEGVSVFAVESGASGFAAQSKPTLDQTRTQAVLSFDSTPARLIGEAGTAGPALARMLDLAAVALAAEQVGGAQRVLEMAVDYAKNRTQFGRAIGSFQAIKHKCATMLLEVESARSAVYYAGWVAATPDDELSKVASLAKAYCSEAYFHAAAENVQIHGGMGFTWEHSAQLYFKRAKSSELLFGSPTYHRELLAQRIGI